MADWYTAPQPAQYRKRSLPATPQDSPQLLGAVAKRPSSSCRQGIVTGHADQRLQHPTTDDTTLLLRSALLTAQTLSELDFLNLTYISESAARRAALLAVVPSAGEQPFQAELQADLDTWQDLPTPVPIS